MEMMHLESILLSICALLDESDVEDPLVPEIAAQYLQDKSRYEEIAREYTSRYAHGESPILTAIESSRATDSTSVVASGFPQGEIRADTRPQHRSDPSFGWSAEDARGYMKLLYQLSVELGVWGQAFDDVTHLSVLSPVKFKELQNFLDFCTGEFCTLVGDERWKTAFPNLPLIANDATRGTGNSFTYRFLERGQLSSVPIGDPIRAADAEGSNSGRPEAACPGLSAGLGELEGFIIHVKWLNGDSSLVASNQARSSVGGLSHGSFKRYSQGDGSGHFF